MKKTRYCADSIYSLTIVASNNDIACRSGEPVAPGSLFHFLTLFPMAYFDMLNSWGGGQKSPPPPHIHTLNTEPQIVRPSKLEVI